MAPENRTAATGADQSEMTRAQIEALFARRQDDYDNLDAASLAGDYADDAVIDSPVSGRHGKEEAQQSIEMVFRAFLDLTMTTDALVIDGTHVAQVVTLEGTNIGGLFGLPPSGKSFKVPAVDFTGVLVQVGVLKAKPV